MDTKRNMKLSAGFQNFSPKKFSDNVNTDNIYLYKNNKALMIAEIHILGTKVYIWEKNPQHIVWNKMLLYFYFGIP